MSTKTQVDKCQGTAALISQTLVPWWEKIGHQSGTVVSLSLSATQLPLALAALPSTQSKFVISTAPPQHNKALCSIMAAWSGLLAVNDHWHSVDGILTEQEQQGIIQTDLSLSIHHLLNPQTPSHHFVIPESILATALPDPAEYQALTIHCTIGERIDHVRDLITTFVSRGYVRHDKSLEPGSVRLRGEQLDIAHPLLPGFYTITLYGRTIESIIHHWQRRTRTVSTISFPPLKFPPATMLWSHLLKKGIAIRPAHLSEYHGTSTIIYDALTPIAQCPWHTLPTLDQAQWRQKKWIVFYTNRDHVQAYLKHHQINQSELCQHPLAMHSFALTDETTVLISEKSIFPHSPDISSALSYERGLALVGELTIGKPAVHADHGIGIYEGLHHRTLDGHKREYLILRYAAGDTLSVPVEYAHKVSPFTSDTPPTLHRLGNVGTWLKTRRKAQAEAATLARELLQVAQKRNKSHRPSFQLHADTENYLDQHLDYRLTPDQVTTWNEVRNDLQQSQPMDRLVVGDVGFGKTEIAQRAACHVADNGRQVAVIAPTTLLVQQHADTFKKRLKNYGGPIGMLSRFISPAAQKKMHEQIANGKVRIVIGTHALLSPRLKWHNLGLVIIDEEQRFGVKQKEHFKQVRSSIDLLSLTATPIPRTLSMALSGLRQLSVIATPPEGRKSVTTTVAAERDQIIQQAIKQELSRHGQVYVVSPRVRELNSIARKIQLLVPHVRLAQAHGQMESVDLAHVMEQFDNGQLDVLVSSTIIENGLDLPNANTLLVLNATRLGLSDLYQLRGRVGRRQRQGYAHFLYNQATLTSVQRQRLTALTEATRLGSGWELAQRDLEIRGAGNVLGAEQSGIVNTVGIQFYVDLVHQAVATSTGVSPRQEVDIQLPLPALLPPDYIADLEERTRWYQRLSRADSLDVLHHHVGTLTNTFGPLPPAAASFILLLTLHHVAGHHHISKIYSQTITPPGHQPHERLMIKSTDPINLLKTVQSLGKCSVRHQEIIVDLPKITPTVIEQLIVAWS